MSNVAAPSVTMDDVAPSVRDTIRRSRLVGRSVRARDQAIAHTIVHARTLCMAAHTAPRETQPYRYHWLAI